MGVASVNALDHTVPGRVYAAPAPQLRAPEAAPEGVAEGRAIRKPNEEQVQPVKAPAKAEPAPEITAQKSRIRVDQESKRIVVQVIGENNEVVRQIPAQELLEISAKGKQLQGLIFDQRA